MQFFLQIAERKTFITKTTSFPLVVVESNQILIFETSLELR